MGPNLLIVVKDGNDTGLIFEPQITVEITSEQIIQLIPLRIGPRIQVCMQVSESSDSLFLGDSERSCDARSQKHSS